MVTEYTGSDPIYIPLLKKSIRSNSQDQLFKFTYESNPKGRNEDMIISFTLDCVDFIYNPIAI